MAPLVHPVFEVSICKTLLAAQHFDDAAIGGIFTSGFATQCVVHRKPAGLSRDVHLYNNIAGQTAFHHLPLPVRNRTM